VTICSNAAGSFVKMCSGAKHIKARAWQSGSGAVGSAGALQAGGCEAHMLWPVTAGSGRNVGAAAVTAIVKNQVQAGTSPVMVGLGSVVAARGFYSRGEGSAGCVQGGYG
jgi:hypothetical protein